MAKRNLLLISNKLIIVLLLLPLLISCASAYMDPKLFGIYTATLDGKEMKLVAYDSVREINHARVSPDEKWITFTRYNKLNRDGLALETNGYEESEIMLMRMDGSGVEALVPARKGAVAANGYWTPDGKGIVFVSTDDPSKKSEIKILDAATRKIKDTALPQKIMAADPHMASRRMVTSVLVDKDYQKMTIWISDEGGGNLRQLTDPKFEDPKKGVPPLLGDFDPKLSPDGTHVAFMRHMGKDNWHVVVADTKTGAERDLSEADAVDAVPEWSSDGKLLIFWSVTKRDIKNSGLYTMRPDGSGRERVPLPRGYFYTMPAFFPNDGSGPKARIIFSAKVEPMLR